MATIMAADDKDNEVVEYQYSSLRVLVLCDLRTACWTVVAAVGTVLRPQG